VCDATFAHWDHFAYCNKTGKPVFHQNSVLSQVKKTVMGDGFSNLAKDNEAVVLTCVICSEKVLKEKFTVKKGDGFTVTSTWKTLARRSKPPPSPARQLSPATMAELPTKKQKVQILWNWSLCSCGQYDPSDEEKLLSCLLGYNQLNLPPPCCSDSQIPILRTSNSSSSGGGGQQ
jgi:hypothetical protein